MMEMAEGVKNDRDKIQVELLSAHWLFGVGQVLTFGAKKYAAHNWRNGIARTRLLGACLRHVFAYLRGEDYDPETGLLHLYHASCCLMFAAELHYTRPDTDDRYKVLTSAKKDPTLSPNGEKTRDSIPDGESGPVLKDPEELRVFSRAAIGDLGHPGFSTLSPGQICRPGIEVSGRGLV